MISRSSTIRCVAAAALLLASPLWAAEQTNHTGLTISTNSSRAIAAVRPEKWATKLSRPGLSNFYQVTPGLYRGAQPSTKGMAELQKMGVKIVVNLRSMHSDQKKLLGIDMKQGRLHMQPWRAEDDDVVEFLKLATATNNLPVFVHCKRGADRTGMVCAMYRVVVCGWTKDEAIREMKEGGFGFNSAWKNIVRYIQNADIEAIKRRAGIPTLPSTLEAKNN